MKMIYFSIAGAVILLGFVWQSIQISDLRHKNQQSAQALVDIQTRFDKNDQSVRAAFDEVISDTRTNFQQEDASLKLWVMEQNIENEKDLCTSYRADLIEQAAKDQEDEIKDLCPSSRADDLQYQIDNVKTRITFLEGASLK